MMWALAPEFHVAAWRFGAACLASTVVAGLLALLLPAAARRRPALGAHRGNWLLAQGAVTLVFALAWLPRPWHVVAPASLPAALLAAPVPHAMQSTGPDVDVDVAEVEPGHAPATDTAQLLAWLPAAWLAIYCAGLAWHSLRRLHINRRWHAQLLRHARLLTDQELRDWRAITPDQRARIAAAGLRVRTTALPVSPLLLGGRARCLVLPAHLGALTTAQQTLIVEHELTHWRRADPLWLAVAGVGALLFWFNRPFQRLVEGLREAVELGCDDAVLAGRGMLERQSYAAALVAQLKLDAGAQSAGMAPAFGLLGVAGRVRRMQKTQPARLTLGGRIACACAALAVAAAGTALQPAISAPASATASAPTAPRDAHPVDDAGAQPWRYPLATARVTSLYGVRSALVPQGHHGVDFAARRGTPVLAAAAGLVAEAAFNPTWGNYVRIDHGHGRSSLAIHLDASSVAAGQRVAAGDIIGAAGASGAATGPHLHFEYWQDGRRRDPGLMLADLASHATPRALARRRAQGDPVPTDE